MLTGDKNSLFSLRRGDQFGVEILSIKFNAKNDNSSPRTSTIHFFNSQSCPCSSLHSKKPKRNPNGDWVIDLGGLAAMRSIKNCVYIDNENTPYIIVAKSDENNLTVNAHNCIPPECVFAVGIASFLCKA